MTDPEVSRHVLAAGELWKRRSARVWTLDLSMLADAGVTLARPENTTDRAATAERALRQEQQRDAAPEPLDSVRQRGRPPRGLPLHVSHQDGWVADRAGARSGRLDPRLMGMMQLLSSASASRDALPSVRCYAGAWALARKRS